MITSPPIPGSGIMLRVTSCLPLSPTAAPGSSISPWARWSLRRNPFGEPPPDEIAELVVADMERMVAWAETPGHALQLIGDQGRGKSARLSALHRHVPTFAFVYLAEGAPIPDLPRSGGLLLDEAQRLPPRRRRRLFAALDHLVLTSHENHEVELERAGWKVWTVQVGGLDAESLDAILRRRLRWAWNGSAAPPEVPNVAVGALLQRYGDDVRAILDELYERFQRSVDGADLWEGLHGKV